MNSIRIPVKWLLEIAADLKTNPDKMAWEFTSNGWNVLVGKRTKSEDQHHKYDGIDFELNPDD